jgi:16S rRNA (cytosine1402-N4)-methyltransferase
VRYRGTHPRRFGEKYKELAPERYPDEVEKAIERGGTPAGSHLPVMLDEVITALAPAPGQVVLDATLGYGGHAQSLAARLVPGGRLIGIDRDGEELSRTEQRLSALGLPVVARHANHSAVARVLRELGIDAVDGVLADLGCSSMQLDRSDRGFSLKSDGPLDLRMDRSRGASAAQWLTTTDSTTLAAALREHADEPDAASIATCVCDAILAGRAPQTTHDLVELVLAGKGIGGRRFRRPDPYTPHPAARTFQALRMVINREHEHLAAFLRDLPWLVRPGGRVALITFHSGEERRVEQALADGVARSEWEPIAGAPLRPSRDETRRNPRSRSARLWTAVRAR